MEVGGCVTVLLGICFGKSSQNLPKLVDLLLFWVGIPTMCILYVYVIKGCKSL